MTYAGLRYVIAFVCLLPVAASKGQIREIKNIERGDLAKLIMLGILFYSFTQGTQFIGLSLLPSVTVSLILNFTPIIVAIMGIFLLSEKPTVVQWLGAFLFIAGILVYFYPVNFSQNKLLGIIVMIIGVLANSASAILGRDLNRNRKYSPLTITIVSMGVGSIIMLIAGLIFEGLPPISLSTFLFLLWLAVVNTAFAFTIWNLTLQKLTAMESSIINGTMLLQIAILAWIFLGEQITMQEGFGMFMAATGAVIVQIKKRIQY